MALNNYNIAITIDDNYVQHACVMLQSLISHTKKEINVYCIYKDLSEKNIEALSKHFQKSLIHLTFLEFNSSTELTLPVKETDHVTESTFLRIWLPNILTGIKSVLFLDTDIIINGDISFLLDLEIEEYPIAAVEDTGMTIQKKNSLNIPTGKSYFNAGVLKINLHYFRQHSLTEQIVNFIKLNPDKCEFWDQDALNAVIKGYFFHLDYKYNVQGVFYDRLREESYLQEALQRPIIIHFTGGGNCKPWFYKNKHPHKNLYRIHLGQTPFKYYVPPDLSRPRHVFKKIKWLFQALNNSRAILLK